MSETKEVVEDARGTTAALVSGKSVLSPWSGGNSPVLVEAMSTWVGSLAPWRVMATYTFRWEASIWSAQRCVEKFHDDQLRGVSVFYALEANPSRDGYHCHEIWADCDTIDRRSRWATWFARYGRNRIEPIRSQQDVHDYCAKYVCKQGAWWNVELQWHRQVALREERFKLAA